jgi:hypothetical protein
MFECLSKDEAFARLQSCLDDGGAVIPTHHFRQELQNENLSFQDALHVLTRGRIFDAPEPDIKTGNWKYRIEGHEPEGLWIAIIFCFKKVDEALLITVFSIKGRSSRP